MMALDETKPIYTADHYHMDEGKIVSDPGPTFNADDDDDAWQKANDWSAGAASVLFQAAKLRLRRGDGSLVKERSLGTEFP
jgi:hypothetical protein